MNRKYEVLEPDEGIYFPQLVEFDDMVFKGFVMNRGPLGQLGEFFTNMDALNDDVHYFLQEIINEL